MKKTFKIFLLISIFTLLVGCNNTGKNHVSIGNISFEYNDDIWTYIESSEENAPIELIDEYDNVLSFFVTEESTYQHPLDMIDLLETLRLNNEDFQVFLQPTKINEDEDSWYEYGYEIDDGTRVHKVYHRFYGRYYNAINISYNSNIDDFDKSFQAAKDLMNSVVMDSKSNEDKENKAKEFLVGEWDLFINGYLILNQNGTYEWYQDSSKDKNNFHEGTYGCDIENEYIGFKEGEGFYLVLFPEELIINGESGQGIGHKSDFLISYNDDTSNYSMVNISSYKLYSMAKTK